MASIFSKLFTKKPADGSASVPPEKAPAAPPAGSPVQKLPPGGLPVKTPLPPLGPKPPVAGGTGATGGLKLPKKRITQRITVDPSKAATVSGAGAPSSGLRPASPGTDQALPTMKLTIPGPKASTLAAQRTQKVDTKSITTPLMVPAHVILNALPSELLMCDVAAVCKSPEAQREVPLPLSTILSMLPSGRVELPAQELVKVLPEGWALPKSQVPESYPVALPLAAIVPRIPPEMLAIRPDQKDVDPSVRQMKDPFTQEMIDRLASQASAAQEATEAATTAEEAAEAPTEPAVMAEPEPARSEPEPAESQAATVETDQVEERPEEQKAEPDFAESLRLLAEQAEASLATESEAKAGVDESPEIGQVEQPEEVVEPPASGLNETEAIAVTARELGVKTIDQPVTQKLPLITPPKEPAEEESSSFVFDQPEPASEPETPAAVEASGGGAETVEEPAQEFDVSQFAVSEEVEEPKAEAGPVEVELEPAVAAEAITESERTESAPQPEAVAVPVEAEPAVERQAPPVEPEAKVTKEPEPEKREVAVSPAPAVAEPQRFQVPPPPPKIPPAVTLPPTASPAPTSAPPSPHTSSIKIPVTGELGNAAKEIRIHLNQCGVEDLVKIPGVSPRLARKVLAWRELHGDFTEFSQLLSIPGMTKEIYRQFTGDPDSETALSGQVNVLLGAPLAERLSLRDVAHHIRRWPSIQGCVIAGAEGLPIAKDVTDGDLAESLSAFLPRIMSQVNEAMEQIKAMPADEVHIVSEEMGYFIYRRGGLYLVMLSSEKDLPEYYGKVVRALLEELTEGKKTRVEL